MDLADLYYVARRLRSWLEMRIVPENTTDSVPLYERAVLRDIVEDPGGSIQDIASRLGLSQSMVSKAAKHGISQGWLSVVPDPQDKRRTRLTPSETWANQLAAPLSEDASVVWQALLEQDLSEADLWCLQRTFHLLHQALKSLDPEED